MGQEQTLTVLVPLTFRKRGGRKQVITPDGAAPWASPEAPVDCPMVKALARAFRWRKLLELDVFGTIEQLAAADKINASYIGRVLRLTLLAPEIVEAVLAGRQMVGVTLAGVMEGVPVAWAEQHQIIQNQRSFAAVKGLSGILCEGSQWGPFLGLGATHEHPK